MPLKVPSKELIESEREAIIEDIKMVHVRDGKYQAAPEGHPDCERCMMSKGLRDNEALDEEILEMFQRLGPLAAMFLDQRELIAGFVNFFILGLRVGRRQVLSETQDEQLHRAFGG